MNNKQFVSIRHYLGKTQKQIAELLGISLRAIHGYEQGWRKIPANIERQILFLIFLQRGSKDLKPCWEWEECPVEKREKCAAWEFKAGNLCWFITGTICQGKADQYWDEKMEGCRKCLVFEPINELINSLIASYPEGKSKGG